MASTSALPLANTLSPDDLMKRKAEGEAKLREGQTLIKESKMDEAVEVIYKLLEEQTELFGELALECAPAYFYYGKALFYKAQDEGDFLGAKLQAAADSRDGVPAGPESKEAGNKEPADPQAAAGGSKQQAGDEAGAAKDDEAGSGGSGAEEEEEEGDDDEGGEGEEEKDDMEYAWENLETARHIYSSNREALTADQKLLLAEVYECLAELSMEKEDFQTCISDCKQAKEVYSEVLPETDRRIASLHFKMALALEFMDEPEEGLSHCQTAVKMMESKLEELKSLVPGGGASSGAEDIEGVLSDLRDKESELKEVVAQNNTAKEMIKNAFAQIAGGLTGSGGAGAGGVIDLGVVGGGTGRTKITPAAAPAPAESSGPAESRNTSADTQKKPEKKKRSLEDIMGGGSGGSTTVGFGS